MKLGEALQESGKHIGQLIELLDALGVGQQSDALVAARKFSEEYLKYIRTRRCCMNCTFCKPDDGALHVGRTSDPLACTYARYEGGRDVYIYDDPAEAGRACGRFALKGDQVEEETCAYCDHVIKYRFRPDVRAVVCPACGKVNALCNLCNGPDHDKCNGCEVSEACVKVNEHMAKGVR